MKKFLALILALALVMSLVPATFAAEKNMVTHDSVRKYIFGTNAYDGVASTTATQNYWNTETNKAVSDQWNLVSRAGTNWMQMRDAANGANFQWNAYQYNADGGVVVAIRFEVDEAGTYIPKLSYNEMTDGYIHNIYILPDDGSITWDANTTKNFTAVTNYLVGKTPVATIDMWGEKSGVKKVATLDAFTAETTGNYLLVLLADGYNEKMVPYQPDERTFIRAELNSFEIIKDSDKDAVANGTLTYNLGMTAMNGTQMYTSNTAKIGETSYSWGTFPGLRNTNTAVVDGVTVGSLYNPKLMSWDAVVNVNNKGEVVEEPIQVMNLKNTDPWKIEYLDVYNNYTVMYSSSDLMFYNARVYDAGGTSVRSDFYDKFILFRVKVPYAGKYSLKVQKSATYSVESGPVPGVYFFPVEGTSLTSTVTARTRINKATADEKLGYVNLSNKEIAGCIESAEVTVPNGGEYYIALKHDTTSFEKNPTVAGKEADPKYQNAYIEEISLTPISCDVQTAFEISASKTELTAGETANLTATATMRDAGKVSASATYKSSSPSVATVDANGKITAVAPGKALITAETADGATDSLWVTVKENETGKKISYAVTTNLSTSLTVKIGNRNDKITVTAEDIDGYTFRHWVRGSADNGSWISSDKTFSFNLMTNTYLTAIYTKDRDEKIVEFFNGNGEYLSEAVADENGKVTLPENPSITGYIFDKWLLDKDTEFTADTVLTRDITRVVAGFKDADKTYRVNGVKYKYGEEATFESATDMVWYRNEKAVAYGKSYTYYVWDEAAISWENGEAAPMVVLDEEVKDGNAYMIEYDACGKNIVEVGIIFGNGNHTIESCDSKATSQKTLAHGQFTAKPGKTGGTVARGYLIYSDGDTYKVVYSD